MYVVSILFKGCDLALAQHFKAFKNADEFYKKISSNLITRNNVLIESEDDFNSRVSLESDSISAVSFTDVEKDLDRNGQIQIFQHKSQLKTQNLAQNDGSIKLLSTAANLRGN